MQAIKQHRLTTSEYFSIGELGNKTELIDGVIYDMVPPGANHSFAVGEITRILVQNSGEFMVRQEQPLQILPDNAPQPDIAILKPAEDGYKHAHPAAADALAIIEVSDSSLGYDIGDKMRLYALAQIPYYFVVDINSKQIMRHSRPEQNTYKNILTCKEIRIESLGVDINMAEIL